MLLLHNPNSWWEACAQGNMSAMRSHFPAHVDAPDPLHGAPGLWWASQSGQVSAVIWLLSQNANPNGACPHNTSALMQAAHHGHAQVVTTLLAHGANPRHRNDLQASVLLWGACHPDVLTVLLQTSARQDINAPDAQGFTPLHQASWCIDPPSIADRTRAVALLLEHGANPNVINDQDRTPLMHAAQANALTMIATLIAHGADITATNHHHQRAVDVCTTRKAFSLLCHHDNVRLLCKAPSPPSLPPSPRHPLGAA